MSCFWSTLTQRLTEAELKQLGVQRNATQIIEALKQRACRMPNVSWMGTPLSEKFQNECIKHIRDYDTKSYTQGYLTSSCDPFLLLLTQLFKWKIEFNYMNSHIHMTHKTPVRTVRFRGSRTHFS